MQTMYAGRVRAEPNVTPMIDVMLVLLVIFMIVIPAIASGPAEPPTAESVMPRPEEVGDRTLTIDLNGRYYLDKRFVPPDSLLSTLRAAVASGKDDYVLFVRADKNLRFDLVHDVFSVAGAAGIRVVGLVSEKPPAGR